jgi:RNA polymerase sigma factor (sigma-70 family)
MDENTTARLESWLVRIREGDNTAFDEVLRHFEKRLYALTSKMLKGFPEVAAREQTGDVFHNAFQQLEAALKATIAGNADRAEPKTFHTADFLRLVAFKLRQELLDLATRYRRRPTVSLPGTDPAASASWDPEEFAHWSEFHETAARLPEKLREVFDLLYYGGLTKAEAAEMLDISVKTVRKRWQEACLWIADILGDRLPGQ